MAGRESSFDGHQSRNEPQENALPTPETNESGSSETGAVDMQRTTQSGRAASVFDGETCQKKALRIGNMNTLSLDDACHLLNADIPGRDWRTLGGKFDYTVDLMGRFERKENMARAMLRYWDSEQGNNVENLITKLQEMSCDRVAKIFQDEIDKKGKNCNCPDCRSIS